MSAESIYAKASKIIEERDAGYSPAQPPKPEVEEAAEEMLSIIEETVKTLSTGEHSVDEQINKLLG